MKQLIRKLYRIMPNKIYLQYIFFRTNHTFINFSNPRTFNEKMQWLKVFYHKKVLTDLVDKYKAKKLIAESIGKEYVVPTIGVWKSTNEINLADMPTKFVIKCTHDSGSIVFCKDKEKITNRDLAKLDNALKYNFYWSGREWAYKNVEPMIIAEEYLEPAKSDDLVDYKFMCFNGVVKCIFTCTERYKGGKDDLKVTFFDTKWNKLPFERQYKSSDVEIERPINLELMVSLAEKIARDYKLPFARIDFYEVDGKIYFSEVTLYPGGGFEKFKPKEWDYILGDWLNLDYIRKNEN